jgi:hypothetical protein
VKVITGGTFTAGGPVMSDGAGLAVAGAQGSADAENYIMGVAAETCSTSGDIVSIDLIDQGYWSKSAT